MTIGDFPRQVNVVGAPAVAGDFADGTGPNVHSTVDAAEGAFVAGPNGLGIGLFAWADPTNTMLNSSGAGAPTGFIRRNQQGIITAYLANAILTQYPGSFAEAWNAGSFWVTNSGTVSATIGMTAYANNSSGAVSFNTAGNPPTSASVTAQLYANLVTDATLAGNSITAGSISGTTLTVASIGSGTVLGPGLVLSGGSSSVGYVTPNTTIVSQLTGTAGSTGTYQVNISQNVSSVAIGVTGGGMTVTTMGTGYVIVGQTVSGTGIPTGTTIIAAGTGTGQNNGTYVLSQPATPGSSIAVTVSGGTLTVTIVGSGVLAINDTVTGGTIAAGTYLQAFIPGSGSLGGVASYLVNTATTSASGTVTVVAGTATKWVASSLGAPGELVKMTSFLNG
jgi:hypothetical protein